MNRSAKMLLGLLLLLYGGGISRADTLQKVITAPVIRIDKCHGIRHRPPHWEAVECHIKDGNIHIKLAVSEGIAFLNVIAAQNDTVVSCRFRTDHPFACYVGDASKMKKLVLVTDKGNTYVKRLDKVHHSGSS